MAQPASAAHALVAVGLLVPGPFGTALAPDLTPRLLVTAVVATLVVVFVRHALRGDIVARRLSSGMAATSAPIVYQGWLQDRGRNRTREMTWPDSVATVR